MWWLDREIHKKKNLMNNTSNFIVMKKITTTKNGEKTTCSCWLQRIFILLRDTVLLQDITICMYSICNIHILHMHIYIYIVVLSNTSQFSSCIVFHAIVFILYLSSECSLHTLLKKKHIIIVWETMPNEPIFIVYLTLTQIIVTILIPLQRILLHNIILIFTSFSRVESFHYEEFFCLQQPERWKLRK